MTRIFKLLIRIALSVGALIFGWSLHPFIGAIAAAIAFIFCFSIITRVRDFLVEELL